MFWLLTWASAPDETRTFKTFEKASPVILFECPLSLLLTCKRNWSEYHTSTLSLHRNNNDSSSIGNPEKYLWITSSTRTLYIWIEESSIPIAIMLLSWGWNAKNVAAGGGGMKVVIVCNYWRFRDVEYMHIHKHKSTKNIIILLHRLPWRSSCWTKIFFLQTLTLHMNHS